jgi:hypothetical protein
MNRNANRLQVAVIGLIGALVLSSFAVCSSQGTPVASSSPELNTWVPIHKPAVPRPKAGVPLRPPAVPRPK